MDRLKSLFHNLISTTPTLRKEPEHYGVDHDKPTLRQNSASPGTNAMSHAVNTESAQQNTAPTSATCPTYQTKAETPVAGQTRSAGNAHSQIQPSSHSDRSHRIEDSVDLSETTSKPEITSIALALKNRNLTMISQLLRTCSHEDKLEALASVIEMLPRQRQALTPCIKAILDSVNRGNKPGPDWEKKQSEIDLISKLLN